MSKVDLSFPLLGTKPVPADHGYPLYAALSRVLPQLHTSNGVGVHPIRGTQLGNRLLALTNESRLCIRCAADRIPELLAISGKTIDVAGVPVQVGVPQVRVLVPGARLRSRLVVIKVSGVGAAELTPETFSQAARRQLDTLGVGPSAVLTIGKRRTLRIKSKEIVGYEVLVETLTEQESLTVQEKGLGGRRHMGCGIFVPTRSDGAAE